MDRQVRDALDDNADVQSERTRSRQHAEGPAAQNGTSACRRGGVEFEEGDADRKGPARALPRLPHPRPPPTPAGLGRHGMVTARLRPGQARRSRRRANRHPRVWRGCRHDVDHPVELRTCVRYCQRMDEDLLRIERSLALAPQLPGDVARWLIDEVRQLRQKVRDLGGKP